MLLTACAGVSEVSVLLCCMYQCGLQEDVRSAAVGGRRGDPRRQGARSGQGVWRNFLNNMWRNGGEGGEAPADGTPGFQQVHLIITCACTPPAGHSCMDTCHKGVSVSVCRCVSLCVCLCVSVCVCDVLP